MLVCKIEMWPQADECRKHALGEVHITRISGDRKISHYDVALMRSQSFADREGPWRKGRVINFERLTLGPYDLLLRGMVACIAGRNVAAARVIDGDALLFAPPRSQFEIA